MQPRPGAARPPAATKNDVVGRTSARARSRASASGGEPRGAPAQGKRTAALLVSLVPSVTVTALLPCSGCTNTTECEPGGTGTLERGVSPMVLPSMMQVEGGIEL